MSQVTAIQWDDSAARAYTRYLRQAPDIARQEMTAGVQEILLLLEREIKDATPAGATEALRGSITHAMMGSALTGGVGVAGKVFTSIAHGLPVELGSKPHWPPYDPNSDTPWGALEDWLRSKGVSASEMSSRAFLVARSISRKGTKGAHMFEKTFAAQEGQIMTILRAALDRITARLERGQ